MTAAAAPRRRSPLRRRGFALLWAGGLVSDLGDWTLLIGLPVFVFQLTGSALTTSTIFVAELIPALVVGQVGGVLVDRWDRRRILVGASVLQPQVRGPRDGIGVRLVDEPEAPARGHRPPRPLPRVGALAVNALHEPEPCQLAQVIAAVRRRLADDRGALARGLRPHRHEMTEDPIADGVGERAQRVDVGDASPVRGGHLAAPR